MLAKMRACATFPGTFPTTICPSFWESGRLTTSAITGQRQLWGPHRKNKSLLGVWDFWLCLFDDVSYCRGGGDHLQPQSSDLHNFMRIIQQACKCNKLLHGQRFFFVPAQPQELLTRKLRNRLDKHGTLSNFVFQSFYKIPDVCALVWAFLS